MCSSYLTTMLVTEPASSFSASLRVLHSDGYLVRLHVRVHESWCQSLTLTQPFIYVKLKHKPELVTTCMFVCLKGAQQLFDIIKDMSGRTASWFFKLCWCYLTPLLSLVSLDLFMNHFSGFCTCL